MNGDDAQANHEVDASPRRRARRILRPRPRAGWPHGLALSLLFALLATPMLMAQSWVVDRSDLVAGQPSPVTVRVPLFLGRTVADHELSRGSIVIARGDAIDDPRLVQAVRERQPSGYGAWLTYAAGLLLTGLLYTARLRRSHKGILLRTQAVNLSIIVLSTAVACVLMLGTPLSVLVLPVCAIAITTALAVDLGAALATSLVTALVLGSLTPFDPGVLTVLGVQGATAALVVGERRQSRPVRMTILSAGLAAGLAGAASYFLVYYLTHNQTPMGELDAPLRSAWLASAAAGPIGAALAMMALPLHQRSLGEIPQSTLVQLEDLGHPLLKKIAEGSPGTWQHSLAMANMAEIAANAIGANGRLVRVGAYFHDLGKSVSPKYFIENLSGGEASPHDAIPPQQSCDAIFNHVTEGVRMARKYGLHERIIDFMHMHHGDGRLEYFWAKCQEQGNPDGLTEEDFRYPGVKPDSRETAILAICDAVEAASRTLRNPDEPAIEDLVQRIVYGKLHLGQLDESGLTVADLRRISNSLMDTIKHAHHGRIEYPWQRKQAERSDTPQPTQLERPRPVPRDSQSTTQRLLGRPRLDSLDVPRPPGSQRITAQNGRAQTPAPELSSIGTAATEQLISDDTPPAKLATQSTASLRRPPTAAEVAQSTATMRAVKDTLADSPDDDGDETQPRGDAPGDQPV